MSAPYPVLTNHSYMRARSSLKDRIPSIGNSTTEIGLPRMPANTSADFREESSSPAMSILFRQTPPDWPEHVRQTRRCPR